MTMHSLSILKAAAFAAGLTLTAVLTSAPTSAQHIVDEWDSVQPPAAPELEEVTIENPETTALLMLDFMHQNCNEERRPRCVASLPKMQQLLEKARAAGVPVVYAIIGGTTTDDIWEDVAPQGDEPWVQAGPDKFIGTDLEQILKDRGIETVITVGTAAHGAVLHTASAAALRGFQVIVPVDGISAEDTYFEQYVVHHLKNAPRIGDSVTLTTSEMIGF